jgi:hypothetical protein
LNRDLTPQGDEPDLDELAGQINREHEKVETALRTGLKHARAAGDLLLLAKKQLAHGKWLPWLKANVAFSERAAQSYMRIADRWDELTAKSAPGADLTYKQALALLAESGPVAVTVRVARAAVEESRDSRPTHVVVHAESTKEEAEPVAVYAEAREDDHTPAVTTVHVQEPRPSARPGKLAGKTYIKDDELRQILEDGKALQAVAEALTATGWRRPGRRPGRQARSWRRWPASTGTP